MALLIIILIIWLMLYLASKGKKYRAQERTTQHRSRYQPKSVQEQDDELITVILPTINNDKPN